MKKTFKAITAIIIALTCMATLVVTAQADSKYIERTFTYGRYSPTVVIHHPVYNWVLEAKPDGSLIWAKPKGTNAQLWVIFPTEYKGYYAFREFNNGGWQQRYITYTPKGFRLAFPGVNKDGGELVKATQAYRFSWRTTHKCGGKTFKNVWCLFCKESRLNMCAGGWGGFRLEQTNA